MQRQSGQALDRATAGITGLKGDRAIGAGLQRAWQTAQTLPAQEADVFNKTLQKVMQFDPVTGKMGRNETIGALRELRDKAAGFMQSDNEYQRQLGQALNDVSHGFHLAATKQNPLAMDLLKSANKGYRGNRIVSDASGRATGEITPAGLSQSVKRNDPSKNARQYMSGNAYMQDLSDPASKIMPSGVGNPGSADRYMAGRPLEMVRGLYDTAMYTGAKALRPLTLAKRPAIVENTVNAIRNNPGIARLVQSPLAQGLLHGLLQDEDQ
jgi:hypothetical protein